MKGTIKMEASKILTHVDHTNLKAYATWAEIDTLCQEALTYHTASICIPPCYISRVKEKYGDRIVICTVIGFPLGYSVTAAKVAEAKQAIEDGAEEIDMVINISDVKNGDFDAVEKEIRAIREATENKLLKVIIETCYLTDEEKKKLCTIVSNAKADYIKTSTGFGTAGATFDDVRLFKENIDPSVKIKAAGGIRTVADMETFLELGASRLGTSSAIKLVEAQ